MTDANTSTSINTAEALAAGSSMIPPSPVSAPLATTLDDAGGIELTKSASKTQHDLAAVQSRASIRRSPETGKENQLPPSSLQSLPNTESSMEAELASPPPRPPLSQIRAFSVAAIVTTTMALSAGGQQSLNISLPTIQTDLNMREADLQWISSAYSLTSGCFLLLSGRLADVHGRKFVFLCGISWYAIWCLVGGFMQSPAALVVTRALAGSGASMSLPSAIGIVAMNFHGKARSTAFAAFSAGAPVGGGIGLVVGGLLTSYASWRAVLWFFAGLAGLIGVTAFLVVPPDVMQTVDKRIDWIGAALVTVGLVFLQFVVSDGQTAPDGWKTGYIIALLILSILLIAGFFLWERHVINNTSRPPLMRLQLWTRARGRLAAIYFVGFVSWMGFTSVMYHATLFFQQVQQTGAIGAMIRFIPTSVWGVACNVIVAYLINVVPTQWIICAGILATGLSNVFMALSDANTSYWQYPFQTMWMCVMGADFLMATGSIFVSALSLPDEQSVAGALFQTLVQLGGSFGLAITTVIADSYTNKALSNGASSVDAILAGLKAAFWLGAGCSFSSLFAALGMLRGMGIIGKGVVRGKGKKENEEAGKGEEAHENTLGAGEKVSQGDEKV